MKKSRDLLTTVVLIPALIGTQVPVAAAPIAGGVVVAQAKTPTEEELLRQKQRPPQPPAPGAQQRPGPVQVAPPPPVRPPQPPAQMRPVPPPPPAQVRPPVQMQPAPAQVRPPVQPPAQMRPAQPAPMQPAPAQVRPPVQMQPAPVRPTPPAAPVVPGMGPVGGRPAVTVPQQQAPAPVQPPVGVAPQAPARPPVAPRPAGAPPQGVGVPPAPTLAPAAQPQPVAPPPPPVIPPQSSAPMQPIGAGRPGQPPVPGGMPQGMHPPQPGQPMPPPVAGRPPEHKGGLSPLGAAAIGVGVGVVGGFLLSGGAKGMGEVQGRRERVESNGVTYIREPGRTIVEEDGRAFVRHDETGRFRDLGLPSRTEDQGDRIVTTWERPDGSRLVTVTDRQGRLLKRIRILPDGRRIVLIDNDFGPRPQRWRDEVVVLPPLVVPDDRYVVDAGRADTRLVYETLVAPPVDRIERRYSLDEVRASQSLRARMRSVDLDTITFDSGSWDVTSDQARQLAGIADAIRRAIDANPQEVFLIEGHTDRVGSDIDNLSLSDRRAEAVAVILTRDFGIPPENLTTQGYGEQYPKIDVDGPSRENRRVTIRRITPLIAEPQAAR